MNSQLSIAIARNFRLKTKIMLVIFSIIFIFQMIGATVAITSGLVNIDFVGRAVFVPVFLIAIVIEEIFVLRYINRKLEAGESIRTRTFYLVSLLEISFPSIVFGFGSMLSWGTDFATPYLILNSPPEFLYFIFLLTASFLLNSALCITIGVVAAIEYLLLCILFLSQGNSLEFVVTALKSVLILGTGILTGIVSGTIRKSVIDSLESQRILIEELDSKVKERTSEIHQQKEIIEEKQKEILDSINYARRIQYTLLAHDDVLIQNLPGHFVLFKPKDIVSGDFYWSTRNDLGFYLAVCDCTGHGVPGAFMSLLNISFLNEAINEKNIHEPHEILNHVRDRLITNMEGSKDGMDATLVRFEKNKMVYSSAHNRPVLIRNGNLKELPADKMPVGKGELTHTFTRHEIDLVKDDWVFFYTDGYADQFGGPKGKKFKYSNLQKLLLDFSHLQPKELQDKLQFTFEAWKRDLEQVDDVCVIGIRV